MNNNIFISIACFMDRDILNTIENCINKAKNPNNLVFGICSQMDLNNTYLDVYNNKKNFKIIKLDWKYAKGPTYARYLISKLVTNEKYFLQIDAHTRFFNNWDEIAINCLNECNDKNAILTAFPISIKNMHKKNIPLNISTNKFKSLSYNSIKLGSVCCSKPSFVKTYYLSAAFIFGSTKFLKDVPYDPYLTYSYQTIEQQFYAIRLFTYGWNLYKPSKHILATHYGKTIHKDSKGNIIHPPSNHGRGKLSWERVLYYYGLYDLNNVTINKDIALYGLGNKRSLDNFFSIHNEKNCINKIKNGLNYNNGVWSKYNFYCKNNIFAQIINKYDLFKLCDKDIHFEWKINTKVNNKLFQHYNMSEVAFIDNKYTFFKLLTDNNIKNIPKTYFDINNIKQNNKNKNYFLKYAGNNGGKNVFLYNNIFKLSNHVNNDLRPYIIQEEVPDMLLINNRKFVLRIWIVIVDNKFYITSNGCCIIHEHEYNKNSKDRKIHIDHDISKISYSNYNEEPFYKDTMKKIVLLNTNVCNIIKKKLRFKKNCYQVLGLDIIFDNNLNPYIIEFNSWPNMSVPYDSYKSILKEFFTNFLNDIVINKLNNQPIVDTDYFVELKTDKEYVFKIPKRINNNSIPVVVINNNNPINICDNYNFNVSYFNKILIDKDTYKKYLDNGLISNKRYKLRLEQVSSWVSHLHIWKEMIKDNIDKLLILEDTCKFVSDFSESYNKILRQSKSLKYDILYIGYSGIKATERELSLVKNGFPRLTSSYIISLNGAKKMVKELSSIDYPFDELLGKIFYNKKINGYRTSRLLTYQKFQMNTSKYFIM